MQRKKANIHGMLRSSQKKKQIYVKKPDNIYIDHHKDKVYEASVPKFRSRIQLKMQQKVPTLFNAVINNRFGSGAIQYVRCSTMEFLVTAMLLVTGCMPIFIAQPRASKH